MLTQAAPLTSSLAGHGAGRLTAVHIDTYNAELCDEAGFIGGRASGRAFRAILDDMRERVSRTDDDPAGDLPSTPRRKKRHHFDGAHAASGLPVLVHLNGLASVLLKER